MKLLRFRRHFHFDSVGFRAFLERQYKFEHAPRVYVAFRFNIEPPTLSISIRHECHARLEWSMSRNEWFIVCSSQLQLQFPSSKGVRRYP